MVNKKALLAAVLAVLVTFRDQARRVAAVLPMLPFISRDRKHAVPVQRRPQSAWWSETMSSEYTSDDMFRVEARLPRSVFHHVVKAIEKDKAFAVPANVGRRRIPVDKQLMCFLLRVGNNEQTSIVARRLGISASSVPVCVRRVAIAIARCLGPKHLSMPRNGVPEKAAVKAAFRRRSFKDAVGIIDCTHVRIVVPFSVVREGNVNAYINRKSLKTLTYQAITTCEASPRFLNISGGLAGAAYDTRVMEASFVHQNIQEFLEGEEYILGDLGSWRTPRFFIFFFFASLTSPPPQSQSLARRRLPCAASFDDGLQEE